MRRKWPQFGPLGLAFGEREIISLIKFLNPVNAKKGGILL